MVRVSNFHRDAMCPWCHFWNRTFKTFFVFFIQVTIHVVSMHPFLSFVGYFKGWLDYGTSVR